ncbi:MAG: ComEA family DNA-binding protein [Candidatus Sumerlaeota bacterium]
MSDREMYGEDGRLDLNLADATALDALPRIGPSRADAIIEWRKQNGSFSTTRDLLEIHGIGEKTLELLEPLIFVESTEVPATQHNEGGEAGADKRAGSTIAPNSGSEKPIAASENTGQEEKTKIDINSAGQEKLEDLWNIGPAKARAIIEWRQTNGPFRDIEQIQEVPGIGPSTLERNRDRLICR